MAYKINPTMCVACGTCMGVCPVGAISKDETSGKYKIDSAKCVSCSACASVCPVGAISPDM